MTWPLCPPDERDELVAPPARHVGLGCSEQILLAEPTSLQDVLEVFDRERQRRGHEQHSQNEEQRTRQPPDARDTSSSVDRHGLYFPSTFGVNRKRPDRGLTPHAGCKAYSVCRATAVADPATNRCGNPSTRLRERKFLSLDRLYRSSRRRPYGDGPLMACQPATSCRRPPTGRHFGQFTGFRNASGSPRAAIAADVAADSSARAAGNRPSSFHGSGRPRGQASTLKCISPA